MAKVNPNEQPANADLNSLSPSGSAPRQRISTAQQVRDIYNKAVRDNQVRSRQRALVKGLVDGNPPHDQAKLDQSGQRYRANFNNGKAESYLNTAKDSFYDLFSEVPNKATIMVDGEGPEIVEWGEKVTKHFEWLQNQDDTFDFTIQVSQHDMVLYGIGPVVWEDDYDWRVKRVPATNVYVPMHCKANVTDFQWVLIYRLMPVGELYAFISDEEAAKARGWDPAAVKKSIVNSGQPAGTMANNRDWRKWEIWQQAFRDGDLWVSDSTRQVGVIQMLYQEFSVDGEQPKISEVWVDVSPGADQQAFLFRKANRYDDMRQAMVAFFYDRGDGSAHGVRGLGVKMQKLLTAENRLQNSMVDNAFARSSIMVKPLGNQPQSSMSPVALGPWTLLPNGFEVVTGIQNAGVIDAQLSAGRELDATLTANLAQYRQNQSKTEGNPRTAFEVAQNVSQSSSLQRTQIARYYEQLDDMYAERFRRASNPDIPSSTKNKWLKLALEFQARCAMDGVPPEVLKACKVKATRTVGQGSPIMRIGMLNQILGTLGGMLPEDGKMRLVRDLIAAQAGQEQVNRYMPTNPNQQTYAATQVWEAQVENGSLRDGTQITITPLQNDVLHLQEHISFASQAASAVQQGADPAEISVALNAIGRHAALHLQRLSTNPMRQAEFKAIKQQFDALARVADQITEMAEKQQPNQPQAPPDPELMLQAQKDQQTIALKAEKQQAQLALKAQQQKFNQDLKAQQQGFDQTMRDMELAAEIQTKRVQNALAAAESGS